MKRIVFLVLVLAMCVGCCGATFAEGSFALLGTWAYDYDSETVVLKVNEDGTAWYKEKDYSWEDRDGFLLLTDEKGETCSLRYTLMEDKKVIYPKTSYHRGKEVEGQGGLIGIWEGTESESSFVFTPTGYFLEDSVFAGNFQVNTEAGAFLLHYGDVFADTLCYYTIENEILTVEYPWTLVEVKQ